MINMHIQFLNNFKCPQSVRVHYRDIFPPSAIWEQCFIIPECFIVYCIPQSPKKSQQSSKLGIHIDNLLLFCFQILIISPIIPMMVFIEKDLVQNMSCI